MSASTQVSNPCLLLSLKENIATEENFILHVCRVVADQDKLALHLKYWRLGWTVNLFVQRKC